MLDEYAQCALSEYKLEEWSILFFDFISELRGMSTYFAEQLSEEIITSTFGTELWNQEYNNIRLFWWAVLMSRKDLPFKFTGDACNTEFQRWISIFGHKEYAIYISSLTRISQRK